MQITIAYCLPTYLLVSTKELTLMLALQRTKKAKLKKKLSQVENVVLDKVS